MSLDGVNSCQVCQTNRFARVVLRLPECEIVRCANCGFVYLGGDRSVEELHRGNQTDQFGSDGYLVAYDPDQIAEEQVESVQFVLRRAGAPLDRSGGGPALDVGCARGHFLRHLSRATGWKEVTGVDTSSRMTEWGSREFGLDLRSGGIEDVDLPEGRYGLVTCFDVLEHVAFPRDVLGKLMRLLRPGGWIVLEVPSEVTVFRALTHLGYRLTGGRLDAPARTLYHPAHLSYFTPGSLRKLILGIGGTRATIKTKEAHVTRFGLARYRLPARLAARAVTLLDKLLGTEAKLLCAFQRPV